MIPGRMIPVPALTAGLADSKAVSYSETGRDRLSTAASLWRPTNQRRLIL